MRNTNSHFSYAPSVNVSRSSFDRPSTHKTTFDKAGLLYPIYVDEVLPGDTHSLRTNLLIRTSTPIFPVMDNLFMDIYFFFIPNRLVHDHWKELMGENTQSAWIPSTTYHTPKIQLKGVSPDSVLDHMGIRPNNEDNNTNAIKILAYPVRAFALCWNEWFRNEAIFDPINIYKGDNDVVSAKIPASPTATSYLTGTAQGGICPPVSKFGDYFTSGLPSPQKGANVLLPLGLSAPIFFSDNGTTDSSHLEPTKFLTMNDTVVTGAINSQTSTGYSVIGSNLLKITNGYADLSNATAATINDLRMAFQTQKLLETDARSGSRYVESILAHFGVRSPDARQQRPEYLGGKRVRINMQQVLQTSASQSGQTPQGNVSGFSCTADSFGSFSYSATEHGFILGMACIRSSQTYQYGIERFWFRDERLDYYFPVLAHLGEQEIYQREIYHTASTPADSVANNFAVFAYQEAWAEYRYKNSLISGSFRSNSANPATDGWSSLDAWHYAEKLSGAPTLSPAFIAQSNEPIARTLAVPGDDEFIADFYFDLKSTRCMPTYSIPGLVDHF